MNSSVNSSANSYMNRAARRAKPVKQTTTSQRSGDTRLAAVPWRLDAVWSPLEQIIAGIARDGTVETANGSPIFRDNASKDWYETAPVLHGLADFHRIASDRKGWGLDVRPLETFANKLSYGSPIVERDIEAVRACADQCKRMASRLTVREAQDILTTVRIGVELEAA